MAKSQKNKIHICISTNYSIYMSENGVKKISNQWDQFRNFLKKINPKSIKDLCFKINQDNPQKADSQVR